MVELSVHDAPATALQTIPGAQSAPFDLDRYLITDATGRQVEVLGAGNTWHIQPAGTAPVVGPAAQAVTVVPAAEPLLPRWFVRLALGLALGGIALGGVCVGLELLAAALEHLAHALAELLHVLVLIVALAGGVTVAAVVLRAVLTSSKGEEDGGNSVTNNFHIEQHGGKWFGRNNLTLTSNNSN